MVGVLASNAVDCGFEPWFVADTNTGFNTTVERNQFIDAA